MQKHLVQPVRLLLVAEAPPWKPASEPVSYIYKPDDGEYAGGLLGPIVHGVARHLNVAPPEFIKKDAPSKAAVLAWLGQRGVLLVDPLPFALSYTKLKAAGPDAKKLLHGALRASASYPPLCEAGWQLAMRDLSDEKVVIHPKAAVAFSLKTAARGVLAPQQGARLPLPGGRAVAVAEDTHCFASSAGYPNEELLVQILGRMPMPPR